VVIGSPHPNSGLHPALAALVENHGRKTVGAAYRYVHSEELGSLWQCLTEPGAAGEQAAALLERIIASPDFAAWNQ